MSWTRCWPQWAALLILTLSSIPRRYLQLKALNPKALQQGLPAMGLTLGELEALLAGVGDAAARGSVIAGELPAASRQAAADLLACAGLLGRILSLAEVRSACLITCCALSVID